MGFFVVLLCIVGAIVAQHTRHYSMGTTEGRLACLEDMYIRLQNEDARLKQQMAEKEGECCKVVQIILIWNEYTRFFVYVYISYPDLFAMAIKV